MSVEEQEGGQTRAAYTLAFHDISYYVKLKGGKTKQILHGVSGACFSGRLMALMGPSGAGKTSLLDILADAKISGSYTGQVLANGVARSPSEHKHMSGYVQQKDVLMPSATVRESLTTTALLRLPYHWTKKQKIQRVEELLEALELKHVAESLIGEETLGMKGISGGEKRRTSVGLELVKDPALLFLDEPTTGLDSEMALGVMAVLRRLALGGKMVVCTIHQPNSDITDQFHDWMLLARGRLLYGGPWARALPYFETLGYPCPMYKNPTDFFMKLASEAGTVDLLAAAFGKDKEQTSFSVEGPLLEDVEAGLPSGQSGQPASPSRPSSSAMHCKDNKNSSSVSSSCSPEKDQGSHIPLPADHHHQQQQQQHGLEEYPGSANLNSSYRKRGTDVAAGPHAAVQTELPVTTPTASWGGVVAAATATAAPLGSTCTAVPQRKGGGVPLWYQVWVLMVRFFRCWIRTPIMIAAEASQYIVLGVFTGLLYLNADLMLPEAPLDRMSSVFLLLTLLMFVPSYTALVVWDYERLLLRRESETGTYRRSSFFLAKTLVSTPIEVFQVTLYAVTFYFMVGFQQTAGKFLIFWVTVQFFTLASETFGVVCAIITPDSKVAVGVLSVLMIIIISFSGYLVRRVPVYFAWIGKISYFSFASDILVTNEFQGLYFTLPTDPTQAAAAITSATAETPAMGSESTPGAIDATVFIPAAMQTGLSMSGNLAVLFGITAGFRVLAWLLLELAAKLRRL